GGLCLVVVGPLGIRHPVDGVGAFVLGDADALRVGRFFHPVREAIAAEAGKIHHVDILHVGARTKVLDQAAVNSSLKLGPGLFVHLTSSANRNIDMPDAALKGRPATENPSRSCGTRRVLIFSAQTRGFFSRSAGIGSRSPVVCNTAFAIAGATVATPISPIPLGGLSVARILVWISGSRSCRERDSCRSSWPGSMRHSSRRPRHRLIRAFGSLRPHSCGGSNMVQRNSDKAPILTTQSIIISRLSKGSAAMIGP